MNKQYKVLVFDNYDSFTYNLVQILEEILDKPVDVYRNDEIDLEAVGEYDKIILSPGPGIPEEAGLLLPLIKRFAPVKSILGVCLGHQAIAEAFGGKLVNLSDVFHGVATNVTLLDNNETARKINGDVNCSLFHELPQTFEVGRYHSWVVSDENFPGELIVTARDENGYIMALQHQSYDVQGVQFHPESVLTPLGRRILENWLG